jgi:hypothetical protein
VTEDIADDAKTKATHKLEVEEKALSLDQSLNQEYSDEDYTVYDCDVRQEIQQFDNKFW